MNSVTAGLDILWAELRVMSCLCLLGFLVEVLWKGNVTVICSVFWRMKLWKQMRNNICSIKQTKVHKTNVAGKRTLILKNVGPLPVLGGRWGQMKSSRLHTGKWTMLYIACKAPIQIIFLLKRSQIFLRDPEALQSLYSCNFSFWPKFSARKDRKNFVFFKSFCREGWLHSCFLILHTGLIKCIGKV